MIEPSPSPRRRWWPLLLVILIIVLAGGWSAVWYYGADALARTIDGWKMREAQEGRAYSCARQEISGFPFGARLRCGDFNAELTSTRPPFVAKAKELLVSGSLLNPTVLRGELVGPLTIAEPGRAPEVAVRWREAHVQARGLPTSPEQVTITFEEPVADRAPDDGTNYFKAGRVHVVGRMLSGTVRENPVIEITVKLVAAAAPYWHTAAATPTDADLTFVIRGLKDFAPKPWPVRFRELQAADGRIEVKNARVQQGETIAVAEGALGLSPAGGLDGQLRLTVANLDKLMPALGLDRLLAQQGERNRLSSTLDALDRLVPGLGNLARQNAGPMIVAGVNLMGQQTELEGRRAVALPLRFNDGAVSLGPLPIGQVPPLF